MRDAIDAALGFTFLAGLLLFVMVFPFAVMGWLAYRAEGGTWSPFSYLGLP